MPPATAVLDYAERFSEECFGRISLGLIPEEMEDRWFVYREGMTLYLHRSWTGTCIYEVEFEAIQGGVRVRRAVVNRDPTQYGGTDDAHDLALLRSLIHDQLLDRQRTAEGEVP